MGGRRDPREVQGAAPALRGRFESKRAESFGGIECKVPKRGISGVPNTGPDAKRKRHGSKKAMPIAAPTAAQPEIMEGQDNFLDIVVLRFKERGAWKSEKGWEKAYNALGIGALARRYALKARTLRSTKGVRSTGNAYNL